MCTDSRKACIAVSTLHIIIIYFPSWIFFCYNSNYVFILNDLYCGRAAPQPSDTRAAAELSLPCMEHNLGFGLTTHSCSSF